MRSRSGPAPPGEKDCLPALLTLDSTKFPFSLMRYSILHRHSRPSRLRPSVGFTLIELLVVITIIALLAGLLLPVVSSVTEKAHKTEAKSTEMQIIAAVKSYQTDYGQYPVEPNATPSDATFDKNTAGTAGSNGGKYGHNSVLFNVLRASNNSSSSTADATYKALNSRQVVYFDSNDVKFYTTPKSGFIPVPPTGVTTTPMDGSNSFALLQGDLIDPWGNLYYVRIDADYSTMVYNPYAGGTTDAKGTNITYGEGYAGDGGTVDPTVNNTVIRTDVIAWSPGKDWLMGTNGTIGTTISYSTYDDVVSWQ